MPACSLAIYWVRLNNLQAMGSAIIATVLVLAIMDYVSAWLRRQLIEGTPASRQANPLRRSLTTGLLPIGFATAHKWTVPIICFAGILPNFSPAFRPAASDVLHMLLKHPKCTYRAHQLAGRQVRRLLATLALDSEFAMLGDTRQHDMDRGWTHCLLYPESGGIQVWRVSEKRRVDLRRPIYNETLLQAAADGAQLSVVADTCSLQGALPLMMGIPFLSIRTAYTPDWCVHIADAHPMGHVLDDMGDLSVALDALPILLELCHPTCLLLVSFSSIMQAAQRGRTSQLFPVPVDTRGTCRRFFRHCGTCGATSRLDAS